MRHNGDALKRTKNSWIAMHSRCGRVKDPSYIRYGARGIKVCARWATFQNFLADMGLRPEGKTLDRIDSQGHYGPFNCRWATKDEQTLNRKGASVLEYRGRAQSVRKWGLELGLGKNTLARRLRGGWALDRAMTTPGQKSAPKGQP